MQWCPGIFQFGTFLIVTLSESNCSFALGPSSSSSNSFFKLFIHSGFLLCSLSSHILHQNCFTSFLSGMSSCILPLLAGRIFFRFLGMSCFVHIVLSCLRIFKSSFLRHCILIYLFELHCLFHFCFFPPFVPRCIFLYLSIFAYVADFLSMFPV